MIRETQTYIGEAVEKCLYIIDYKVGWYIAARQQPYNACGNDAQRDGWVASHDKNRAMLRIGVRHEQSL